MRRSERDAKACRLLCGRQAVARIGDYQLCQVCIDRVRDIERTASERRAVLLTALTRGEKRPGSCAHGSCEAPVAAQSETEPCDRYCVAHCVTHKATHTCRRNVMRQARARYRERQRVA